MIKYLTALALSAQLIGGAMPYIRDVSEQISNLFPKTKEEVELLVKDAKEVFIAEMDEVLAVEERDEANTLAAYDAIFGRFHAKANRLHSLELVEPSDELRAAAQSEVVNMAVFADEWLLSHPEIYKALSSLEGQALSERGAYFLKEELAALKEQGLHFDDAKREKLSRLNTELMGIQKDFAKNIQESDAHITCQAGELTGIDPEFVAARETDKGIRLGCDYPTYLKVMKLCTNGEIRKQLYMAFMNRAYPENEAVLLKVIEKNAELANLLGFESFAALDVARVMAESPEKIDAFLTPITEKAQKKAKKEFEMLTKELPEGVSLSPEGKLYPWDLGYVTHLFLKKHHNVDDEKIAEYFPLEKTVSSLIDIYEQFFDLRITELPAHGLWHKEARLLSINDRGTNEPLGYLILDLFPRSGKYTHACMQEILHAWAPENGRKMPGIILVIANFPRETKTKPALLTLSDAKTFFHEFGHAIHGILGSQPFTKKCGTNVKLDFVEMPSQILEEWLWDRDILKQVGSHYETGEALSDEMIDSLLAARNVTSGMHYARQCLFSHLALDYYRTANITDTSVLLREMSERLQPDIFFCDESHFQASFGHLTNYGAKYYSYLWSKVYALDLFEKIREHGLLNTEIGRRFRNEVLGEGGGRDPNQVLEDFLGRPPSADAFFRISGLEESDSQVSS